MDSFILKSKISTPIQHSSNIRRAELESRLTKAAESLPAVSLITAPPGYGKTFLVSSWITTREHSSWLTINSVDNIFISFIRYLYESIRKNIPSFGALIAAAIASPITRPPQYLAELFSYEIEMLEFPLSVVIDNYHEIKDSDIHNFLSSLLDNIPFNLHLLILAEEDPPISVSRRRLNENLLEIRQNNLSFSLDETANFFLKNYNLIIPDDYLKKILQKTEGWPAAVTLSAMYLSTLKAENRLAAIETSLASYKYIIDYFTDSVIVLLAPQTMEFIEDTVLFESFNPDFIDFIRNRKDSIEHINKLQKQPFPVLIQEDNFHWLRYHSLFSEYIKSCKKNERSITLFKRASQWFDLQKNSTAAIHYALLAADYTQLKELLLRYAETLFLQGRFKLILQFLKEKSTFLYKDPDISIFSLWANYLSGNYTNPKYFENSLPDDFNKTESLKDGRILCLKAWILFDQKNSLCEKYADKSLSLLEKDNSFFSGMARLILGKSLLFNGRINEAADIFNTACTVLENTRFSFVYSGIINNLIHTLLLTGKPDEALRTGEDYFSSKVPVEIFKPEEGMILSAMARVHFVMNNTKQALDYAQNAVSAIAIADVKNFMFEDATLLYQEIVSACKEVEIPPAKVFQNSAELLGMLSRREIEIIRLLSDGLSNQEISIRLFISIGTVKWHLNNIFSKMDVKNRTQAVLKAREKLLLQ